MEDLEKIINDFKKENKKIEKKCCDKQNIIKTDGYYVCCECGIIKSYEYEYIILKDKHNFIGYDKNKYLRSKLDKIFFNSDINSVEKDNMIENITYLYNKINNIINENNYKKKYSINYNFLIYKIMEYLKYDTKYIKITNNLNIKKRYDSVWNNIIKDFDISV